MQQLQSALGGQAPQQGSPGIDDPRFKDAISLLEDILKGEPDEQDSQKLAQLISGLYSLVGDRQKEQDQMIAGKLSPRAVRRMG